MLIIREQMRMIEQENQVKPTRMTMCEWKMRVAERVCVCTKVIVNKIKQTKITHTERLKDLEPIIDNRNQNQLIVLRDACSGGSGGRRGGVDGVAGRELMLQRRLLLCADWTVFRTAFPKWRKRTPPIYGQIRMCRDCLHIAKDYCKKKEIGCNHPPGKLKWIKKMK